MKPGDMPRHAPVGTRTVLALALRTGHADQPTHETVIDEEPVALEINGLSHAVMLCTPLDLEDFALGFLLTERLITSIADLLDCEREAGPSGTVLRLRVTARCEAQLKSRRRAMAGRTGCGLCGVDNLEALHLGLAPVTATRTFSLQALGSAMRALVARQPLQHLTGGVHAAAWCGADGAPVIVREDVGRHNALDKLVGALARAGLDAAQGFIAVTSRASYEMVHKAALTGTGLLAAVSAPTGHAIAVAERAGLTLAGFVRDDRATVYSNPRRVIP
jgi:FdhD protein